MGQNHARLRILAREIAVIWPYPLDQGGPTKRGMGCGDVRRAGWAIILPESPGTARLGEPGAACRPHPSPDLGWYNISEHETRRGPSTTQPRPHTGGPHV